MLEIRVSTHNWMSILKIGRITENVMNWKQSAAKRDAQREAYKDELRARNDVAALLAFQLPRIFEAIKQQVNDALADCPCDVESEFDHRMRKGSLRKRSFPPASLTFGLFALAAEKGHGKIMCETHGLSATNGEEIVKCDYQITVSFGKVTYARLDDTGAVGAELPLPLLIDDMLEPFAECIA